MTDHQPPVGPPPPQVPVGWTARWNEQYHEWFYVNLVTKKSQWETPTQPAYDPETGGTPTEAPPGYTSGAGPAPTDGKIDPYAQHGNLEYINTMSKQDQEQADAALASRLQAAEDQRHGGGIYGSTGFSQPSVSQPPELYSHNSYPHPYQQNSPYPQSSHPQNLDHQNTSSSSNPQHLDSYSGADTPMVAKGKSRIFGKLASKLKNGSSGHGSGSPVSGLLGVLGGKHSSPHAGLTSQQGFGYGHQQAYPHSQTPPFGGGQGMPYGGGYGYPGKKPGGGMGGMGGMMGGAALGVGAGLIGGALIADAVDDAHDDAYAEGYQDGQDGDFDGGGGDFGGDF